MKYLPLAMLFTASCHSVPLVSSPLGTARQIAADSVQGGMDPILSWVGAAATIAGIVALVVTRGSIGIRAVVIGVGLVLLNQAIAKYSDWLFLPVLIATGAVSLTYGYRTIQQVLKHRNGD